MTQTTNSFIISFLNKCSIYVDSIQELDGYIVERSMLLDDSKLDNMTDELEQIRECFTCSTITALQTTAKTRQKWVLLNMVRQLLKILNYNMVPFRKSNGYDETKKKLFIRYFKFEKIVRTNTTNNGDTELQDNDNTHNSNELSL